MQYTRGQSAGKSRKEKTMTPQRPNVGGPNSRAFNLSEDWLVGFIDGEGCFHVGISKHNEVKFGYQILPELTVVQHERDISLLYTIRSFMKCGVIRRNHGDRFCWRVRNLNNLANVIVPFFEKHKLRSKKMIDFCKFAKVVRLMQEKKHLTEEGFKRILKISQSMNRGGVRSVRIKRESIPE